MFDLTDCCSSVVSTYSTARCAGEYGRCFTLNLMTEKMESPIKTRSAKMFVSFAAAIIYMAVFVSATPLSTPTCKPQFKDTLYNVVSSTSTSWGWKYRWQGNGQISPAVEYALLLPSTLASPDASWYIWPNNGSSPDWTISSANFARLDTCALAPEQALPAPLTTGACLGNNGYGVGASVFSINCEICGEDGGGFGCFLTMPFIGPVCPSSPPWYQTSDRLVTLSECEFNSDQKWDISKAPAAA